MDHNSQGRRGHFHRGRRGPDRRGSDRRQVPSPEQTNRSDRVDVEQIMRDIRARIAQRSGIELSNQQIQELAGRRLEAILDPRALKPGLLDQLRRSAGERPIIHESAQTQQPYSFEEATLYDSHRGVLRFIRRLLNPILKLFFNPTPVAHALAVQTRLNAEFTAREAERDRRQAEWNALHYEILQRLVMEVSRVSLEAQSLLLRVESLAAKVDFNERRVRGLEGAQVRTARAPDTMPAPQPAPVAAPSEAAGAETPSEGQTGEAPRRRRRRRRGRRGSGIGAPSAAGAAPAVSAVNEAAEGEADEGFEDEPMPAEAPPAPEQPVERQADSEVALDHRLPEPAPRHDDATVAAPPPRADNEPGTPEQG